MTPKDEAKAREIRAMLDAAAAKAAAGQPKRGPGRPRTGVTPAKDRQAKVKAELERGGGLRKSINLPGESMGHIATIRERDGMLTDTDAILAALAWYAGRRIAPHKP
jgi:hypothetical protein